MSTPGKRPLLFEALSVELWERIFLFASPQDILRLSLVNRACRELVQTSPSIRYKIDLFAVGLQRNPQIEAPISHCRQALAEYLRRWETLEPTEKWTMTICDPYRKPSIVVMGGVYGLHYDHSIKFFELGSISRGIPRREWEIPVKDIEALTFAFYPQANVVAIVGNQNQQKPWEWEIQLKTMFDGKPHPSAQTPVLPYVSVRELGFDSWEISITGSRLALICMFYDGSGVTAQLVVWDWNTGEILLEFKNEAYHSATLVDDFWLAILRDEREPHAPPGITLLNTKETKAAGGELVQTTFYFDPSESMELLNLLGGHGPSCAGNLFTTFYPDPSQRVFVIGFFDHDALFVIKAETILMLAQERRGDDLRWEEWQDYVPWISPDSRAKGIWVSGSRLCCTYSAAFGGPMMEVYDFSAKASGRSAGAVTDGTDEPLTPSSTKILPVEISNIIHSSGCHDSIVFLVKSGVPNEYTVHSWNFV